MTEFEEKDGKLVEVKPLCGHHWTAWYTLSQLDRVERRDCFLCDEYQILVPKGYGEDDNINTTVSIDFGKILARVFGMLLGLGIFGCIKYLFF